MPGKPWRSLRNARHCAVLYGIVERSEVIASDSVLVANNISNLTVRTDARMRQNGDEFIVNAVR